MPKILFVLEHVRQDYVTQHKDGTITENFLNSRSGQDLKRRFKAQGIPFKDIDVTYMYPKIPEANKIDFRTKKAKSYKSVTLKQVKPFYEKLEETIVTGKYDVVVPVGNLGTKYFLGRAAITKLRGVPQETEIEYNGEVYPFWVFPMYSMEYINFKRNEEPFFEGDLRTLGDYIEKGDKAFKPELSEYDNLLTIQEVRDYFNFLKKHKPLSSWDLETNTLRAELDGAKALCITISHEEGQGVFIPLEHREFTWKPEELEEILEMIKDYVADKEQIKVLQNGRFDIKFLMCVYNIMEFHSNRDTKTAYFLTVSQEQTKSFRLTDLAYEFTNMGGYDAELEDWKKDYIAKFKKENSNKAPVNEVDGSNFNYEWFPMLDMLAPYAAGDVDCCRRIYLELEKKINTRQEWIDANNNFYPRLVKTLAEIEYNGVQVDEKYIDEIGVAYKEEEERLDEAISNDPNIQQLLEENMELYEIGLNEWSKPKAERDEEKAKLRDKYKTKLEFNAGSPQQKQQLLFDVMGIRPSPAKDFVTDKAKNKSEDEVEWSDFSTNGATLEWIKDNVPEAKQTISLLLDSAKVKKLYSTYVVGIKKMINPTTGRLHGRYNEVGTECVAGDTLVVTSDGIKRIDELSNNREPKTFSEVNLSVPTHNGYAKVGGFFYNGVRDGYKLTLHDGTELTTTDNHPLLVNQNYKTGEQINKCYKELYAKRLSENSWTTVDSIEVGDFVMLRIGTEMYKGETKISFNKNDYKPYYGSQTKSLILPTEITPELAEWWGMYVADGSYSRNSGSFGIGISNSDEQVLDRWEELTLSCFGYPSRRVHNTNRSDASRISSVHLGKWLVDFFDIKSRGPEKTIPALVLNSTKEVQQAFIRGLSLDTSIKKKKYPSLYFGTTSEHVAKNLRYMFLNMGIYATIRKRKVDTNSNNHSPVYDVMVVYDELDRYMQEIGLLEDKKREYVKSKLHEYVGRNVRRQRTLRIDENYILVGVANKERVTDIEFFDLNVPDGHSFIGNGVVNHNTSRLSSSGPNMQTFPRSTQKVDSFDYKYPIKRMFGSRYEDGVIVAADYSSLEVRLLGLAADDDEMTKLFLEGGDTHKNTAALIYNKPEDEVTSDERSAAKTVSFSLLYGKTNQGLAKDLGLTDAQADQLVDDYFKHKPKVKSFVDKTHQFVRDNGYVETLWGHRRLLNDIWGDKSSEASALRKSVNTVIQGTGAYLTNLSLILIQDYLTSRNKKSKLIMTVHDSIVLDCPRDEYREMSLVVPHIMENLPVEFLFFNWNGERKRYPIESDVEVGFTYKDQYSYDLKEDKTFNSIDGYIKFNKDISKIVDYHASGKVTDEQRDALIQKIEDSKEQYQNYEPLPKGETI